MISSFVSRCGRCEKYDGRFHVRPGDPAYDVAQRGRAEEGVFDDADAEEAPGFGARARFLE